AGVAGWESARGARKDRTDDSSGKGGGEAYRRRAGLHLMVSGYHPPSGRSDPTRCILRLLICALLPLAAASYLRYTTWDEPWHEDVVRSADSFVELQEIGRAS